MATGGKPFVGRDRELELLETGLTAALAGRGSVVVLAGEPGIGKTRLADELAARATARGARVVWGRCWETGPAPAYWPWLQVLRELAAASPEPELAPLLEGTTPLEAQVSTPDVEAARFRLHDAALRALKAAGAHAPLLVVLDDLHAADLASLSLLLFVARNVRTLNALLVCTTREAEVAARPQVESLLHRVAREGSRLTLPRLSREDVASLVRQLASGEVTEDAISAVFRSTDGTPLYVDEAVRLLESRGQGAVGALSVEAAAREVLAAHLALVPEDARRALDAAAVMGREFQVRLLARVLEAPEASVERALDAAERARVVTAAGPGRFRFVHVLLQEALYARLPPSERRTLHRAIARVLEQSPADGPPGVAAHHALSALPDADLAWALALAHRAADEAKARLAYDAAADLYVRARAALPSEDTGQHIDLLLLEAGARLRSGGSAQWRQLSLEAIAIARRAGDAPRLARSALALGGEFQIGLVSAELIAVLEEAQAALGPEQHPGLRAQLLARHAAALQPALDPSGPVRMAHRALVLARETDDPDALQATLYSVCSAFGDYEDPDVRAPLNREFVNLALGRGDKMRAHRGLIRLAIDLVELGRLAETYQLLAELEALARATGVPQLKWRVPLVRSMLAGIEGRFADCDALLEEARALGAGLDDWNVSINCAFHRFGLAMVGERKISLELAQQALDLMPGPAEIRRHYVAAVLGAVAAQEGDAAGAAAQLNVLGSSTELVSADPGAVMWLAGAARLARAAAPARAMATYLRTRRFDYFSWGAMGFIWGGPAAALHGQLEAALGNLATAERLQVETVEKLRALEAHGFLPRALCELSRTRLEMGNREGALPLLDEAIPAAEAMGQVGLVPQLIAMRGGKAEPKAVVEVPKAQFSLAREGESWAVTHAGRTFRLRDTRGLQMLDVLLKSPGQEFHALDLAGAPADGAIDAGDSGELLDDSARAQYRARAAELREDLEEAEAHADLGRTTRLRAELEFLEDELKRSLGLGGKSRKSASAAERARVNVQRRIKDVLKKIEENDSVLAQHLAWAVKTGTFCSYRRA